MTIQQKINFQDKMNSENDLFGLACEIDSDESLRGTESREWMLTQISMCQHSSLSSADRREISSWARSNG